MNRTGFWNLALLLLLCTWGAVCTTQQPAAAQQTYTRTEDVIYGRKDGMALTMDVFTPKTDLNGAAVIFAVSGGWFSSHEAINPGFVTEMLKRGYTVFAVVHGSQPKYTIPEILLDMHRAVRYIRFHAKDYKIDPDRLGISGGSAGGHLSLMQGTAGNMGDLKAKDPVDRMSSRVQAVACFFPPTDFLNYGETGKQAIGKGTLSNYSAPFDFHVFNTTTKVFEKVTDEKKIQEIAREISPIYHINAETPPTLIIHGDADTLVPIQQSKIFIAKLKEAGIPAELVVKPGQGHGWLTIAQDIPILADWFDKYLKKKP
jgi:acetyl esterase/lipase